VSETGAVLQFEFETEFGTIVQCSDIVIQRAHPFVPLKCDPNCQNGGVCSNGICKCGKQFSGETCEIKLQASGAISFLIYLVIILLVAAGIYLLVDREKMKKAIQFKREDHYPGENQSRQGNNFDPMEMK